MPTSTHPTASLAFLLLLLLTFLAARRADASIAGTISRGRNLQECAGDGGRSKQCGADPDGTRPEFCCDGHVCVEGAGVLCVLDDGGGGDDGSDGGEGGGGGGGGGGNGIYQDGPVAAGGIVVEGTSLTSTVGSTNIQIDLPDGATPKAFLFMFMGDTAGADEAGRVAYHDNWEHLIDVSNDGSSSDLNLKVQHKVWSGNRNSFKVWDGAEKVVTMPSMLGVDGDAPIVDSAAVRFDDEEMPVAPSVNAVDGGAVIVVYYFDDADIVDAVESPDGFSVLASDETLAGNSMSSFVAATETGCTSPVAIGGSGGAGRSGIAFAVSLRPDGGPIDNLEDCSTATADGGGSGATTTPEPTAEPTFFPTVAEEGPWTVEPTFQPTNSASPTPAPTKEPTMDAETPQPTQEADEGGDEPTGEPTDKPTFLPPKDTPSGSLVGGDGTDSPTAAGTTSGTDKDDGDATIQADDTTSDALSSLRSAAVSLVVLSAGATLLLSASLSL